MQHSVCNFTLCILRRVSEFLAESFDILLMGDMFFDENLGGKLSNLARTFKETCPKSKMVLIGDPGRWLLSEQKNRVFQSTLIWKVQAFSLHTGSPPLVRSLWVRIPLLRFWGLISKICTKGLSIYDVVFWWRHDCTVHGVFLFCWYLNLIKMFESLLLSSFLQ